MAWWLRPLILGLKVSYERYYQVLPGTTRYYKVVPGNNMYWQVMQGSTRYYRVKQGIIRHYKILQDTTRYCQSLQSIVRTFQILPGPIIYYQVLKGTSKNTMHQQGQDGTWPQSSSCSLVAGTAGLFQGTPPSSSLLPPPGLNTSTPSSSNLFIYQARGVQPGSSRVSDSPVSSENIVYEAFVLMGELR